jgi:leucyl aminopeptidase (aminopeptidase T)
MIPNPFNGALNLLRTCANAKPGEQILIVTDLATDPKIANTIMAAASRLGVEASKITMKTRTLPGQEPPPTVVAAMLAADIIICPTSRTLYHTNARTAACANGARFISMAGATLAVLGSSAMLANFPGQRKIMDKLVRRLTSAKHIHLDSPAGADIEFNVEGRRGYGVTGMARRAGDVTGMPDIEAYIAPVEASTNGCLVVDGSTSVTGVVKHPIKIIIAQGMAQRISGGLDARRLTRILREARSRSSLRIGEFGIGLNPLAHIRGSIIEDEGKLGTAHVALGDNTRLGGTNKAPTHVDLVLRKPHVQFDGTTVLKGGRLTL